MVDLSLSPAYRKGHIPGAWYAIRTRLKEALPKIPITGELVLTSEDGILAGLAVEKRTRSPRRRSRRCMAATPRGALPASVFDRSQMADEPLDVWPKPYERPNDTTSAMSEYLAWETDLLPRIARDGTTRFMNSR